MFTYVLQRGTQIVEVEQQQQAFASANRKAERDLLYALADEIHGEALRGKGGECADSAENPARRRQHERLRPARTCHDQQICRGKRVLLLR